MQLRLLAAGSLLYGGTLIPAEVKAATPQEEVSFSLQLQGCKPRGLVRNPKRTALLIANQKYKELDELQTPVVDATALADKLGTFGFEVTLCTDLNNDEIATAALHYAQSIASVNELSVFYFAGHGSEEVLYGVDTTMTPNKLYQPANIADVLDKLDPDTNNRKSAAVLIIDACRTANSKQVESQVPKPGVRVAAPPDGTFVVYSTAAGMAASDAPLLDRKNHSIFAAELLAELDAEPTLDVDELFRVVRLKVKTGSNKRQVPWTSHSLVKKVSFKESKSG